MHVVDVVEVVVVVRVSGSGSTVAMYTVVTVTSTVVEVRLWSDSSVHEVRWLT